MARYTGPRVRVSRRFGIPIFGPTKYLERRNYGPGMHGPKSRRKVTDYGLGLLEKQKLRYYYGLLERQFRGVYERALRRRGVTGEQMLQILETRLDNVVYHLGFANTRAAARQLVGHGHVRVNGRKVSIPSYALKVNDVIAVLVTRYFGNVSYGENYGWQYASWTFGSGTAVIVTNRAYDVLGTHTPVLWVYVAMFAISALLIFSGR